MRCTRVRALVELYAGNDLPPPQQERLRRHLSGCAACQDELARLQRALAVGKRFLVAADGVSAAVGPESGHAWSTSGSQRNTLHRV